MKLIHGVEIYLTETLEEKVRDNYHTVLLAKNPAGILELNTLVSRSCDKAHFYYTNRLSFDEFLEISDNIITTSACLASPLNRLPEDNPWYMRLAEKYDYLEVQAHNHPDQIAFNQRLSDLAKRLGKPLIAGTDTHSSTPYKAECRSVLLRAKRKSYGDEDAFDLTYKTFNELYEMFSRQGALPDEVFSEAIENTNVMAAAVEDFTVDRSAKYPILYGSREEDNEKLVETVERKFREKCESGVIPADEIPAFRKAIDEELEAFRKLDMMGFMLAESEIVSWCKENGMAIGTARGSVGGSRVAYVTDIIDMDPEKWGTVFSRFCNVNRVEPGDIDTDVVESDRPRIFEYIIGRFGREKTARVASFGTIQGKGVIDDVGRALAFAWKENNPGKDDSKNPWSLNRVSDIKKDFEDDEEAARKKYSELFYYYDGLVGTRVSQSVHPAGIVISPITLPDHYGVFDKDGEECLMLDMEAAHDANLIKFDMLVLKTVQVIRDTCRYLGKPYPKTSEVDWEDAAVWEDMIKDQTAIFQFESDFAQTAYKRYKPRNIYEMSLLTASLRPSGASYRDQLWARKEPHNATRDIDEILAKNSGWFVYQEDTLNILQKLCGFSGSDADSVRRLISKKDAAAIAEVLPKILDGYCAHYPDKPREIAEQEAKDILKVIEDSSAYSFNYSHSVAYCLLGYLCGFYRYYHTLEFLTAYLNDAANDDDIRNGTAYAKSKGIAVTMPKWGISRNEYSYDREKNTIAKGLASVKYMSSGTADELYALAHGTEYRFFTDVLTDLCDKTAVDTRQLDILIKLDFFSEFGNQRELLRLTSLFYDLFKKGAAKKISREKIEGSPLEEIVARHSCGTTKSGDEAKSYTILDMREILHETEAAVKAVGMEDLSDLLKIQNSYDALGYVGFVSGRESDRPKLYIKEVYPAKRRSDGKQFGYNISTYSIGSGRESRFTIFNAPYGKDPVRKGEMIHADAYRRDGKYFTLTAWHHIC